MDAASLPVSCYGNAASDGPSLVGMRLVTRVPETVKAEAAGYHDTPLEDSLALDDVQAMAKPGEEFTIPANSQLLDESNSHSWNAPGFKLAQTATGGSLAMQNKQTNASGLSSDESTVSWRTGQRMSQARDCEVDPDVLRSMPAHKALYGFGAVLRNSRGDGDTYALSEPADKIAHFWSHSWWANMWHKICTLLLVYAGPWAALASVVAAAICCLLVRLHVVPGNLCMGSGCETHAHCPQDSYCETFGRCFPIALCCRTNSGINGTCPVDCDSEYDAPELPVLRFLPFFVGALIFVAVVFFWRPSTSVFLDKVCIHQTDLDKKQRGIDGLGGFLRMSSSMVVLWDETYFNRLWCTFELAAYLHLRRDSARIPVIPVVRGWTILLCVLITYMAYFSVIMVDRVNEEGLLQFAIGQAIMLVYLVFFMRIARRYAYQRSELIAQLTNFSPQAANCWCCSVGHVHPETKEEVKCDRLVVYHAIRSFFPRGLEDFQAMVRGPVRKRIEQNLNGLLSFREVLYIGLPGVWFELHRMAQDCEGGGYLTRRFVVLAYYILAYIPFSVGVLVQLGFAFRRPRSNRCFEHMLTLSGALVAMVCMVCMDFLFAPIIRSAGVTPSLGTLWLPSLAIVLGAGLASLMMRFSVKDCCRLCCRKEEEQMAATDSIQDIISQQHTGMSKTSSGDSAAPMSV